MNEISNSMGKNRSKEIKLDWGPLWKGHSDVKFLLVPCHITEMWTNKIISNILLTVHLNIFISQYQPTWCTKFYNKFISSLYMFRAHVLIVRRSTLYMCALYKAVINHSPQIRHIRCYKGSSKSFRTFIFSREMVRAGGVVIGRVWECHVTSQSDKPADLAV